MNEFQHQQGIANAFLNNPASLGSTAQFPLTGFSGSSGNIQSGLSGRNIGGIGLSQFVNPDLGVSVGQSLAGIGGGFSQSGFDAGWSVNPQQQAQQQAVQQLVQQQLLQQQLLQQQYQQQLQQQHQLQQQVLQQALQQAQAPSQNLYGNIYGQLEQPAGAGIGSAFPQGLINNQFGGIGQSSRTQDPLTAMYVQQMLQTMQQQQALQAIQQQQALQQYLQQAQSGMQTGQFGQNQSPFASNNTQLWRQQANDPISAAYSRQQQPLQQGSQVPAQGLQFALQQLQQQQALQQALVQNQHAQQLAQQHAQQQALQQALQAQQYNGNPYQNYQPGQQIGSAVGGYANQATLH